MRRALADLAIHDEALRFDVGTVTTQGEDLESAQRELSERVRDLAAAGNLVVVYPEGSVTRDPGWWPMQARTGAARLALTTDAVVLPVAQWGPQRLHDYHAKKLHLRLRTPTEYYVGEPIDLSAWAGRTDDAAAREVTDVIMTAIRTEIGYAQQMWRERWDG